MSDTKELQKEINNLTGKLDRTFAVTDELVFKVRRSVLCLTLVYVSLLIVGCKNISEQIILKLYCIPICE